MSVEVKGLSDCLTYFKGLGDRVNRAQAKAITSPTALRAMESDARNVMNSVVYSVPPGDFYYRTGTMLEEIVATADGDGQASVGMPINFKTEAVSGDAVGEVTYARFMLPEFYTESFFKGKSRETIPRDFLTGWHNAFAESIPAALSQALDEELSR